MIEEFSFYFHSLLKCNVDVMSTRHTLYPDKGAVIVKYDGSGPWDIHAISCFPEKN